MALDVLATRSDEPLLKVAFTLHVKKPLHSIWRNEADPEIAVMPTRTEQSCPLRDILLRIRERSKPQQVLYELRLKYIETVHRGVN